MPRLSRPVDLSSEVIRRLEHELYRARTTVLDLLPKHARATIHYHSCVTIEDTQHWVPDLAADLIDIAEPLPSHPAFPTLRAVCPLCGSGSSSVGAEGFALPEGLRMHLEGTGRASWCDVVQVAFGLAQDEWATQFHAPGSAARADFERKLQERRRKEIQYQLHPFHAPRLIDEGMLFRSVRDAAGLAWVADRLRELGFKTVGTAKARAFVRETNEAVVYADPREQGAIGFNVFRKPIREGLSRFQQRHVPIATFRMPDTRKNDLDGTWSRAAAEAVRSITPTLRLVE